MVLAAVVIGIPIGPWSTALGLRLELGLPDPPQTMMMVHHHGLALGCRWCHTRLWECSTQREGRQTHTVRSSNGCIPC